MRTPEELAEAGIVLARELLKLEPDVLEHVGQALTHVGKAITALSWVHPPLHRRTLPDMAAPVDAPAPAPASATSTATVPTPAAPDAPEPPRPGFVPPPASLTCEEAEHQRRDPTRIAQLRGNGMIFLEKVHYYLQLLDDAWTHQNPGIAGEVLCAIECLPGSRPALPDAERAGAAVVWKQAYACFQTLRQAGHVDADDEVVILGKLGDDPLRPVDTLAMGLDFGGGDPFAPPPGEPVAPPAPEDV